ncbi:hypothetical protein [Paenibacillus sp. PDC88]|uniref:Uncharacterized protein n=1 Tax=Paenibacillus provencensis TaxID=441151 RepID=A0ABW3Q1Z4_9BACL|nr:hypothetical protein [Paenibacillus sp. PDC88]
MTMLLNYAGVQADMMDSAKYIKRDTTPYKTARDECDFAIPMTIKSVTCIHSFDNPDSSTIITGYDESYVYLNDYDH